MSYQDDPDATPDYCMLCSSISPTDPCTECIRKGWCPGCRRKVDGRTQDRHKDDCQNRLSDTQLDDLASTHEEDACALEKIADDPNSILPKNARRQARNYRAIAHALRREIAARQPKFQRN
jgi:hypothetical protein